MSKTTDNLQEAFAGESQANRKYLAFAKKADDEGLAQVAKLFRAAAEAETVHAHNHLKELDGVKSTKDNLAAAIKGESYEFSEMYPVMIDTAEIEGNESALRSFFLANAVEKIHHNLFVEALDKNMLAGKSSDYHVCQVCGNTVEGEAPDKCPICHSSKEQFKLIS
jgi:rubrerythrin